MTCAGVAALLAALPMGKLVDRFGPKTLILSGTALMMVGQIVLAFAPSLGVAIVGRILVGAGDAAIFTSVIRLTVTWFIGPIVPQLSQWIGNIGQVGQIIFSAGVAELRPEDDSVAFFQRADDALYRAKEAGKGQIVGISAG